MLKSKHHSTEQHTTQQRKHNANTTQTLLHTFVLPDVALDIDADIDAVATVLDDAAVIVVIVAVAEEELGLGYRLLVVVLVLVVLLGVRRTGGRKYSVDVASI